MIGQLVLASKTGLFTLAKIDIDDLIDTMQKVKEECRVDNNIKKNEAKKMAKNLREKIVVFVSARHLNGAVHTVKNQMNENSKNFSTRFEVPELNHHLMEGLIHPEANRENLYFVFVESDHYPKRILQRINITKRVVSKNAIPFCLWKAKSKDKLSQVFELIQFGAYVNFYLAMFYGIDPAPVPWVDYFKRQLGQPLGR